MIGVSDVKGIIKQDKIIEALFMHLVALSYENWENKEEFRIT